MVTTYIVGGVRVDANGNAVKDAEEGRRIYPNSPGELMEIAGHMLGNERFDDPQDQALALEQAALEAMELEDGHFVADPKSKTRSKSASAPPPAATTPPATAKTS